MKEKLMRIASDDLVEVKLILKNRLPEKTFEMSKKILSLSNKKDKRGFLSLSNYEFFLFLVNLFNDDKLSYEEILSVLEPSKSQINSWTYEKNNLDFISLVKGSNPDGTLRDYSLQEKYYNLYLPIELIDYSLAAAYTTILSFLIFKSRANSFFRKFPNLSEYEKTKHLNEIYNNLSFNNILGKVKEYSQNQKEIFERNQENAQNRKKYTEELIAYLETNDIELLREIKPEWHVYLSPNALEILYEIINNNNNKEYHELQKEQESLIQKMNQTPMISYLFKHGINPYTLDEILLTKLEELSKLPYIYDALEFIHSKQIDYYKIITEYSSLLPHITKEKIDFLTFLTNNKILSHQRLKSDLKLIIAKYPTISSNYQVLKPIIDFNSIFYNEDILFLPLKEIKNRLEILSNYSLNKNNYIFLLCHFKYLPIYDLIIEKMIDPILFIQICESENPLNTIKRITIYKMISEDYETINHVLRKEITSESKAFIKTSNLDTYLPNIVDYIIETPINSTSTSIPKDDVVDALEQEHRYDQNSYLLGSTLISRPKFLRNYNTTHKLVKSLISGSILTESEYFSLIDDIKQPKNSF